MDRRATSRSRNGGPHVQLLTEPNSDQPPAVPAPAHGAITDTVKLVRDHGLKALNKAKRQTLGVSKPSASGQPDLVSADPMNTKRELDAIAMRLEKALVFPASEFIPGSKYPQGPGPGDPEDAGDLISLADLLQQHVPSASKPEDPKDVDKYKFLPSDDLFKIIQLESVRRCLQALDICQTDIMVQNLVDYICGRPDASPETPTARMLFAILVKISRPSYILGFYQESLYDRDLPFSNVTRPGSNTMVDDLFRKDRTRVASSDSWLTGDAMRFAERCQWQVFVPFFMEDLPSNLTPPPLPVYRLYGRPSSRSWFVASASQWATVKFVKSQSTRVSMCS